MHAYYLNHLLTDRPILNSLLVVFTSNFAVYIPCTGARVYFSLGGGGGLIRQSRKSPLAPSLLYQFAHLSKLSCCEVYCLKVASGDTCVDRGISLDGNKQRGVTGVLDPRAPTSGSN